jgi:hypothetical protein
MKRKALVFGLAAIALLVSSCIIIDGEGNIYGWSERFDWDLQGTWETEPNNYQYARVEIGSDTIRIIGKSSYSIPWPLSKFTSSTQLKGYSEETTTSTWPEERGLIYIRDKGSWQSLEYLYWEGEMREKRLTLESGLTLFKQQ